VNIMRDEWPDMTEFRSWKPGLYALVSSISLPLGYILGALINHVHKTKPGGISIGKRSVKTIAGFFYCFGAGSLLFGVIVELYAEALHAFDEADLHDMDANLEISILLICCILGAVGFYYANRQFTSRVEEGKDSKHYVAKVFEKLDSNNDKSLSLEEFEKMFKKSDKKNDDAEDPFVPGGEAPDEDEGYVSMLIGSIFDSIPEAMMMAFLANRDNLTISFVIAVSLSNLPQSMVVGVEGFNKLGWLGGIATYCAFTAWTTVLTQAVYLATPDGSSDQLWNGILTAVMEGLASGSMLNLVFDVMIPEGVRKFGNDGSRPSGLIVILGFLTAAGVRMVGMKYG